MESYTNKLFKEIKEDLMKNHTIYSDRVMAFYQGALWALANVNTDLYSQYREVCKTDGRLK